MSIIDGNVCPPASNPAQCEADSPQSQAGSATKPTTFATLLGGVASSETTCLPQGESAPNLGTDPDFAKCALPCGLPDDPGGQSDFPLPEAEGPDVPAARLTVVLEDEQAAFSPFELNGGTLFDELREDLGNSGTPVTDKADGLLDWPDEPRLKLLWLLRDLGPMAGLQIDDGDPQSDVFEAALGAMVGDENVARCSTRTGIERASAILNGLPLILDDTKRAKSPSDSAQTLYDVATGRGKNRGSTKGLACLGTWFTVLISGGEAPITSFTEDGGTRAWALPSGARRSARPTPPPPARWEYRRNEGRRPTELGLAEDEAREADGQRRQRRADTGCRCERPCPVQAGRDEKSMPALELSSCARVTADMVWVPSCGVGLE